MIQDMFIQDWRSVLDFSSRASLYCNLSNMFCFKSYLESICVVKFRIVLTRLRIAAHRLLIETGRWVKPKSIALENRKYITCNLIEDEFHFVFVCPMYTSFRHYIPKYYTHRHSMFKFIAMN